MLGQPWYTSEKWLALVRKALKLKTQCGVWATARWMQKQGFTLDDALLILVGRATCLQCSSS